MQLHSIENQLRILYRQTFKSEAISIEAIINSGSPRKYFRICGEKVNVIGTFNELIEENKAFFSMARSLRKSGFNVPEILAVSEDEIMYLQEDMGDISLFSKIQSSRNDDDFIDNIEPLYKKALEHLVRLQVVGNDYVDYSKAWPAERFDKLTILADLNYFLYYFVKQQPDLAINEYQLQQEFDLLASVIADVPADYFMYRDFQSRNILLFNNNLYFIDFQGGRKGPLQYDLVSLLYQVKAALPQEKRNDLTDFYLETLKQHTQIDESLFRKELPYFIYSRLMQVLGAYGFRGLIQGKQHFIESIPYAICELEKQLKINPLPINLPVLNGLLKAIIELKAKYPVPVLNAKNGLKIVINSFSFLKGGIPRDDSGNGGGFVFDCRILPNPGRFPEYAMLTGLDQKVINFLEKEAEVHSFMNHVKQIINQAVVNYKSRNFSNLMFNFGCTGGQHRSVFCASKVSQWLKIEFPDCEVITRHIEQSKK